MHVIRGLAIPFRIYCIAAIYPTHRLVNTATTVAAGAFIASSMTLGGAVVDAAINSSSVKNGKTILGMYGFQLLPDQNEDMEEDTGMFKVLVVDIQMFIREKKLEEAKLRLLNFQLFTQIEEIHFDNR